MPNAAIYPEVIPFMKKHNIDGIFLNYTWGFNQKDLSFLEDFGFIKRLSILSWTINDISPIHLLTNLESLTLQTSDKTPIDFTVFKSLKYCSFYWQLGRETVFDINSLEHLSIQNLKEDNLLRFHKLSNLKHLTIANNRRLQSLEGIDSLRSLRSVEMHYLPKLEELDPIEKCEELTSIAFGNCKKISSLTPLQALRKLKRLNLVNMGVIDSITPLQELRLIEHLSIYGDTRIQDGDLSTIYEFKNLKRLILTNKRGYSHKRKKIVEDLGLL